MPCLFDQALHELCAAGDIKGLAPFAPSVLHLPQIECSKLENILVPTTAHVRDFSERLQLRKQDKPHGGEFCLAGDD